MDALEKFRRDEARRLVCWIKDNKSSWRDITNSIIEQDMSVAQEFRNAVRSLRDNGFYQFIVLLLYTHNLKIENAIENSLLSLVNEYWDEEMPDRVINLLLDSLIEE